jgi:HMG (high mobility group) box
VKKKKDKNRPDNEKNPMTPFFMFLNGMREKIKENNSEAKNGDISKIASELWKNLSDQEKEQWRIEALNRALANKQDTNFEFLKTINPD